MKKKIFRNIVIIIAGVLIWVALYYVFSRAVSTTTYFASTNQPRLLTLPKFTKNISSHKILFIGDVMLDRGVALRAEKSGVDTLFAGVTELFKSHTAVIANLEGTLTKNPSVARKNNNILRFTFAPSFANLLKDLNIKAVSLANNHSSDFGADGYTETKKHLDTAGIISFGSSRNDAHISSSIFLGEGQSRDKSLTQNQEQKICLVGYHDLYTYDASPAVTEINRLKKETEAGNDNCSLIVLFAHWGNEYEQEPSSRQKYLAHQFIDAGADLVIGAHPHVVQPLEIYKNKAIFYSLGNFMFDQDFSYNTTHGLAVSVEISDAISNSETPDVVSASTKTALSFKLIPVSIIQSEVSIADAEDSAKILNIVVGEQGKDSFILR